MRELCAGQGTELDWVHLARWPDLTWYRGSGSQREIGREKISGIERKTRRGTEKDLEGSASQVFSEGSLVFISSMSQINTFVKYKITCLDCGRAKLL